MPEVDSEQSVDEAATPAANWWRPGNVERATQAATREREKIEREREKASHRELVKGFHELAKTRWTDALKKGKTEQAQVWYEAGKAIADGQWLDSRVVNDDPGIKRFAKLRKSLDEVLTRADYEIHQKEGLAFLAHAGKRFEQALKDGDNQASEAWSAAARAVVDGEWHSHKIISADPAITAFQALQARLMGSPGHEAPAPPQEDKPRPRDTTSADKHGLGEKDWVITQEMRADPSFMLDVRNAERIREAAKNHRFV